MNIIYKHTGRIIDVLSLLFCLGMAWFFRAESLWMEVGLVGAAMSFASIYLDTTGRMIAWLRTDYVKTVLRSAWVRPRAETQTLGRLSLLSATLASKALSGASRQVQSHAGHCRQPLPGASRQGKSLRKKGR